MKSAIKSSATLFTTLLLSATVLLTGCDSDETSETLAKLVEIEKQTENGTLINAVSISPENIIINLTETQQLTATGTDLNTDTRDITNELTWTSSNETIATVSQSGLVTPVAYAETAVTITATTINGVEASVAVEVANKDVDSIKIVQISPAEGDVKTCNAAEYAIEVTYPDGTTSEKSGDIITWSVDEATTATIQTTGVLNTSFDGEELTTITAEYEGKTATKEITANSSHLADYTLSIQHDDLTNSVIDLSIGQRETFTAHVEKDGLVSDIQNSINWSVPVPESKVAGITNTGDKKGTVLALQAGSPVLTAQCASLKDSVTVNIADTAELESIELNEGISEITLKEGDTLDLKLMANFVTDVPAFNVTEFTTWDFGNGADRIEAEFISTGTDEVIYQIKKKAKTDIVNYIIKATYDGKTVNLSVKE